jgi:2-polyprenyl-3-methyl-5-hydroxy-6-metoxy-1,4-benzoquinol methylase
MPIDFRDPANRRSYSDREADASWRDAVLALVDPVGAHVVDIGCGGGTYLRAWHDLGAATVTGVDSSEPILDEARESHGHLAVSPSTRATPRTATSTRSRPTSSSSGP